MLVAAQTDPVASHNPKLAADLVSLDLRNFLLDLMLRCYSLGRLGFSLFGNGHGVGKPGADGRSSSALVRIPGY